MTAHTATPCEGCGEVVAQADLALGGVCSRCAAEVYPSAVTTWQPPTPEQRERARQFFVDLWERHPHPPGWKG